MDRKDESDLAIKTLEMHVKNRMHEVFTGIFIFISHEYKGNGGRGTLLAFIKISQVVGTLVKKSTFLITDNNSFCRHRIVCNRQHVHKTKLKDLILMDNSLKKEEIVKKVILPKQILQSTTPS